MPTLTFSNKHFNPVNLLWVDEENDENRLYSILKSGQSYRQASNAGDTWIIQDGVNDEIIGSVVAREDQEVEISQEIHRLEAEESQLDNIDVIYRPPSLRKKNFALNFDGNDVVTVPHSSSLNLTSNWTLEAWIFRHNKDVEQSVLEKYDEATGGGFALRIGANNKVQGGFFQKTAGATSTDFIYTEGTTSIEGKRWYHIAASFNAETDELQCYVNGLPDGNVVFISPDLDSNYTVLQFDGTNDYLAVPNIDVSETAYTLCLWFKSEDNDRGIFSVDAGVLGAEGSDRDIYLEDGNLCARLGKENPEIIKTSGVNYGDGYWHQVTHVFGGGVGQRLYVDGKLAASGRIVQSDFGGQTGINIGFSKAVANKPATESNENYFKGQLAEVSIWSIARSESDIQKNWRRQVSIAQTGLQGLWRLNEGHGSSYHDSTSHENHAQIEGPTTAQMGYLHLENSSQNSSLPGAYIQCPSIDLRNKSFTFECWARRSQNSSGVIASQVPLTRQYNKYTGKYECNPWLQQLSIGYYFSGSFSFNFGGFGLHTPSTLYGDTDWHHWVCVFDRATLNRRIYRDGTKVAEDTITEDKVYQGNGIFILGTDSHNSKYEYNSATETEFVTQKTFPGDIAEVALWEVARSEEQIQQDYESSIIGVESGLLGYWQMNTQLSGSTITDSSGNNNHGHYVAYDGHTMTWQSGDRPYGLPVQAPRWNHFSELRLPPVDLIATNAITRLNIGGGNQADDGTLLRPFKGMLDSLRIWNVSRTPEQVLSSWNQMLQGDETGLKTYYRCDEGAGAVLGDQTANGNNGTIGDNQAQRRPAWTESSLLLMDGLEFDGQDDYVELSPMEVDYSGGLTIEAWVYYESFTNYSRIIDLGNSADSDNIVLCNTATSNTLQLSIRQGTNNQYLEVENILETNLWMHLAATVDASGNATIYKNGIAVKIGQVHLPNNLKRTKNYIGRSNWSSDGYLHGRIDEVRLWKTARTPAQIQGYMRRFFTPIDPQLVALYALDEGVGAAAFDSSANSFHGILGGGNTDQQPTWRRVWTPDNIGLEFDGQDDYVALPAMNLDYSGGLTIEAWVYYESFKHWSRIIELGNGGDHIIFGNKETSNTLRFETWRGGSVQDLKVENILETNLWIHLAVTVDASGNATIYKYGIPVKTGQVHLPNNINRAINYIGRNSWAGCGYFHGRIDEVRVWEGARSQLQIQSNMPRRLAPHSQGLAAYWPTEANRGTILYDKTANAYHGTLGGGEASQVPKWMEISPIQFEGFNFDGAGDYLEVASESTINLTTDFSITAWLKPDVFQGRHSIISKVTDEFDCQYALSLDGEMLRFDYEQGGNNYSLVGGRLQDGWNHVAVTIETYTSQVSELKLDSGGNPISRDENYSVQTVDQHGETVTETRAAKILEVETVNFNRPKITLYVNGLQAVSGFAPSQTNAKDAPVIIGAWGTEEKKYFFAGLIDAVVLRSTALTQAQIQQDKDQRFGTSAPEVVGYWRLPSDIPILGTVTDRGGSANDAVRNHYVHFAPDDKYQAQATLDLSANDSVVTLQRAVDLGSEWTIEAYFKTPLPQKSQNTLTRAGNLDHQVHVVNNQLGTYDNASYRFVGSGINISGLTSGWHHLAAVGHNGKTDFYIDGNKLGTANYQSHSDVKKIGNHLSGGQPMGFIDEVRIWNHARTAEDINEYKRLSLVGTETGLMGYWRFEEASGTTVKDLTPFRNDGTISGTFSRISQSQLGLASAVLEKDPDVDALEFNGSSQYVSMGQLGLSRLAGEPLAIMAWVKPTTDSAGTKVIAGARGSQQQYAIVQSGTEWKFEYKPGAGGASIQGGVAEPDQWTHVAGVYDGDALHLYVNGELVPGSENVGDLSLTDKAFAVGYRANSGDYFSGQISEVSVWTVALTANQVDQYMRQTLICTESGLQGYWNFTEQSGETAHDRTANAKHGTLQNNPTWIEATELELKKAPACLHFNGSDQYVDLVGAEDLQLSNDDFTVEAWIKPESLAGNRTVLGADDNAGSNSGLLLGIKDSKAYMRLANDNDIVGTTLLEANRWHHIVWRYRKQNQEETIFVNGQVDQTETRGTAFTGLGLLRIGRQGTSNYFQGSIADLRIWDTVRTGDEITLNMRRRLSGSEKGLLGYWRLDEVSGRFASDSNPLKNHGVLYGNGSRLPLPLLFNTDAIAKMPSKQARAVVEHAKTLPTPEIPETRALTTEVVPAPTAPRMATNLTFSSGGMSVDTATVPLVKAIPMTGIDASLLPPPFGNLVTNLQNAINDITDTPLGEIRLTSDLLSPFDPFQNLFGFKAEFLHIKNAKVEQLHGSGSGISSGSGFGVRLSGEFSIAGLPAVIVEADFYKNNQTELFGEVSKQIKSTGGSGQGTGGDSQESQSPLSYLINFRFPEPVGMGSILQDVPIIGGIQFYKPAADAATLTELNNLKNKTNRTDEENARLTTLSDTDSKRLLGLIITNDSNDELYLVPGLNGYGTVRVATSEDPVFKFIGDLLGINEIQLHVAVAPKQFNLDAVVKLDLELVDDLLWFKDTGVSLKVVTTPPELTVSLFATFEARIQKQTLKFIGAIGITTGKEVAFNGSLTMQGDWRKPFGIQGLVISDLAAELAGKPDFPWIDRLGYTGKIAVGKAYVMLAGMVDTNDPEKFVYVGDGEHLQIVDIINTLCGPDTVPGELADVLDEIELRKYKISIVPQICYIGKISFTETGITFKVAVTIFGWNADLYVRVDYADGITAYATLDPFTLLGGLLEIRESRDEQGNPRTRLFNCSVHPHYISAEQDGKCQEVEQYACPTHPTQTSDYAAYCPACDADSGIVLAKKMEASQICRRPLQPKVGPQAYLRISPYEVPELYISGYASVLGISVDAFLSISNAGLDAQLRGDIWGMFKTELRLKVASDFSYVYIKAEMRNDFFARIREEAVRKIREAADAAVNEISGAQEKIRGEQQKVNGLLGDINRMRDVVRREREASARKFRQAQQAVNAASRKVDGLLNEINSTKRWYNSLPGTDWPWKPSKGREWVWVGPKLAGLYIAYGAAKGVLWAAEKVLQGLGWLAENIPIDMDPRIVALWAAYGVATAALKVAEGVLEGTKYIVKGAAFVAEQITRLALGELFDIRHAKFEGEFSSAVTRVEIQAWIVFLKQNIHINFWFDKNDIAGSIASFVTGLISDHTPSTA